MECFVCRDGTERVGNNIRCPKCGREINPGGTVDKDGKNGVNEILVPKYYRSKHFNAKDLIRSKATQQNLGVLQEYAQKLEKVYNLFSRGEFKDKSFFIQSDKGYGKKVLAYSIIRTLNNQGYTISNIKDTYSILKDLKKDDSYIFEDDYLFLSVQNIYTEYAFSVIEHILEVRASRDKGTMIISNFGIEKLSKNRYSKALYTKNENKLRYPFIVEGDFRDD